MSFDFNRIIDLSLLPVEVRRQLWQEVAETLYLEGKISRQIGIKLKDCPPFIDPDMARMWRIGWTVENKRMKESKDGNVRKKGL